MLAIDRLDRIVVEYDPAELFDADGTEDEVDWDCVVPEYAVSLSFYLAEAFSPVSVEVTPVANLPERSISIEPRPADSATAASIRTAIEGAIDDHDEQGDFWCAPV